MVYIGCDTKVKIIHNKCGKEFEQAPHNHLTGAGCPYCSGKMKSNTKDFILKAKNIHGNEFNYENVNYINCDTKVKIIHNKYGKEFEQIPISHLNNRGCPYCSGKMKLTKDSFVEKATKIHGDKYNYANVVYISCNNKVKITHGECRKEFLQTPSHHLRGRGCPFCYSTKQSNTQDFIVKSIKKHGDEYDYGSVVYISSQQKVKITHRKCGKS